MYKTKNIIKSVILFSFICSCFFGCFGPTIKFLKTTEACLSDDSQPKQEIDNISIELNILPDDTYKNKSFYKQPFQVYRTAGLLTSEGMEEVELTVPYFNGMTPFEVTIINNTQHILRMRDSRILYIDPDSDEPIMALDKTTILEDVESLPIYQIMMEDFKKNYPNIKSSFYEPQAIKALERITKKIKFVNGFNREIMPGMRLKGVIVFKIEPEQIAQGKVSFIDMVSATDETGNPTKKVRFDFRISTIDRFWRYNSDIDKDYTEIDKKEYDKGKLGTE